MFSVEHASSTGPCSCDGGGRRGGGGGGGGGGATNRLSSCLVA